MPNVAKMRRVLYRHDWSSLDEWVEALGELADCSDEAVDEVVRSVHRETGRRLLRVRNDRRAPCARPAATSFQYSPCSTTAPAAAGRPRLQAVRWRCRPASG